MPPTKSWRPLPLTLSAETPVLLISMNVEAAAYTVHITDMANMWTESLDRKAICIRGWGENTSIDPSDTPENMTKFLTSLQGALDTSHPSHDQTKLHLMKASHTDAGDDGLTLEITCELQGLQPLKWPMHLKKAPASAIATDLVLPLIQAHFSRHKEVESLISLVSRKDVVLNKLLDKLDAMGTGLEHVFNNLSGKKKVSRAVAAETVPGLAPFNRRDWKVGAISSNDTPSNTGALVTEVFGGEGLTVQTTPAIDGSPQLDQWWRDFSGASSSQKPSQRKVSVSRGRTPPPDQDSMDIDDDFQVQPTPPHLALSRKPTTTRTEQIPDDALTEDELEPAVVARNTRIVPVEPQNQEAKKPAARLGTLRRKKPEVPSNPPSPQPSRSANHTIDNDETASEAEDDDATASVPDDDQPPSSPPPPLPKTVAKKSGLGLGRIGGPKHKESTPKPVDIIDVEDSEASKKLHPPQPAPKRLGMIGKNKAIATSSIEPSAEQSRGRSRGTSTKDDAEPQTNTRETSRERADRKREELKRELEKKAAAGPAKKKRKF